MIDYEYISNGNKIFNEDYMYKIIFKGYIINNKYPDGNFAEKEIVLFLETHSQKYQFSINYFLKENKLDAVEFNLDKVDKYDIPIYKIGIADQFYYKVNNEILKYTSLNDINTQNKIEFFGKNIDIDKECLLSNNYLILMQDIEIPMQPFRTKNYDININYLDFAKNILSDEELKIYKENYFKNK